MHVKYILYSVNFDFAFAISFNFDWNFVDNWHALSVDHFKVH